jgi:hypothetical protein
VKGISAASLGCVKENPVSSSPPSAIRFSRRRAERGIKNLRLSAPGGADFCSEGRLICGEARTHWLYYSGPEQENKILRHENHAGEMSACGHQPSCSNRLGEISRLAAFSLFSKEKGFYARLLVTPAGII